MSSEDDGEFPRRELILWHFYALSLHLVITNGGTWLMKLLGVFSKPLQRSRYSIHIKNKLLACLAPVGLFGRSVLH